MRIIFMCYIDYIELRLKMVFTSENMFSRALRPGSLGRMKVEPEVKSVNFLPGMLEFLDY